MIAPSMFSFTKHLSSAPLSRRVGVLFLICLVFLLPSCAKKVSYVPGRNTSVGRDFGYDLGNPAQVRKKLLTQYNAWKGTQYRSGGTNKSGVDCSGFVYLTFRNLFGIQLPRTTDSLANTGIRIPPENLKPGDLIFFKTGLFDQHVGIYLDGASFLHVSSKKGVTISSLQNNYWRSRYLYSRRIRVNGA